VHLLASPQVCSCTLHARGSGHSKHSSACLISPPLQVERQADQLGRLTRVLGDVARCLGPEGTALSLEEVEAVFDHLYRAYHEEYVLYNLGAAALAAALPRLTQRLQNWQPLVAPAQGALEFRRWRALLDPASAGSGGGGSLFAGAGAGAGAGADGVAQDPYLALVTEIVLPPLRAACTAWEPRDPEPLLRFMDTWAPLLPRAALDHILQMLVMPRLTQAVLSWEPRSETVAIHTWLHPWLEYLAGPLQQLYPGIRHKFYIALQVSRAGAVVLQEKV
jgi:tuftelin-interacting protein 11